MTGPWFLAVLGLGLGPGCKGRNQPDTGGGPVWELLADDLPGGVWLSAWNDGDALHFVGGGILGAGSGLLASYQDGKLCVSEGVSTHALWWIHGAAPGAFYAVGEAGTILHVQDGVITDESVATTATLYGVYETVDTVWAVGGDTYAGTGEIWRRQDGAWSNYATKLPGTLFKVWEDWFVGDQIAWRMESGKLVPYPPDAKLLTVRGRASDDVWAVGGAAGSEVRHFDGSAWSAVDTSGLGQILNGVWTAQDEAVWVAGLLGTTAWTQDGSTWQQPDLPLTSDDFHAVWKRGDDVFFIGGNLLSTGAPYHGTLAHYGPAIGSLGAPSCQ